MSLGQYVVLGDYPSTVVQIPCSVTNNPLQARNAVVSELQSRYLSNTLTFQGGSTIQSFDNYGSSFHFGYKAPVQDFYIDEIIICFRNLGAQPCQTGNGCAYGTAHYNNVFDVGGIQYGIWSGCGFGTCGNKEQACTFILEEMFHDIYGGNNWHLGGGAGNHTFPFGTNPWGLATQSAGYGSSNVVSAWDREFCSWYGYFDLNRTIRKSELVSAMLPANTEYDTDLQIPTTPTSSTYILRDFVKYGDAIKIKLPHLNCQTLGDVKNQYLWLENHQRLNSDFDHSYWEQNTCKEPWSQGLYAYIQVGKDILHNQGLFTVEGIGANQPNELASWLFPLTAEGNFDYAYASSFQDVNWSACIWNNRTVPVKPFDSNTIPNPLTGFSDLYNFYNSNNDAYLNRVTDIFLPGLSEVNQSGIVVGNAHSRGDSQDAFSFSNGNPKISLASNPSTATVLTNTSGYDLTLPTNQSFASYENRIIWLNGISIEILEENTNPVVFGPGAVKVLIKWDDYNIDRDVRWCAETINLSPNDFNQTDPSLVILSNKKIQLDRGKSATTCYSTGTDSNGNHVFTLPTHFYCLPNSFVKMEPNSEFIIDNGSTLHIQSNSKINMESNSKIIVKNGSKLILEPNSELQIKDGASVIIESGSTIEYQANAMIIIDGAASNLDVSGILNIKDNATFGFTSTTADHGYLKFNNSSFSPSRNIIAGANSSINLIGSSTNRKILEISQETFYGPPTLVNFNISGGNVVFHPNSRMQADGLSTAINFTNVRFTSNTPGLNNGHRGVHLYGQSNVTINGCVFEFGRYGIFSYMTYGGSPLNVIGSIFRHNTYGIRAYDKGLNLVACNFFNNDFGVFGGQMTYPSEFIDGLVGGGVSNRNTTGIRWYGYSTPVLTLNNPYVNTNRTGIDVQSCPVKVKCGSISYNEAEGILIKAGANLFMNDQVAAPNAANVSVFNNGYSIRAVNAENLWLQKGYNVLTPSTMNNERTAFGTLFYPSLTINAEANQWSSTGPLAASDFHLFNSSGANYNINGNVPQATIPLCGQAIPPCPNPPCPNQSPLENCPACDVINTDDFYFTKLNIATKAAIEMLNSSTSGKYTEAINLLSQILNENYYNPDDKEKYLLSLSYIKMMEALGNAYKYGEIFCLENVIPVIVEKVIDVQGKLIDIAINNNDYNYQFKYSMDKAQTLRLACKRVECLNLLNEIKTWSVGDDDNNAVDLFMCEVSIEIQVVNGTIKLGEIEAELANCNQSNERVRNKPNPISAIAPTEILQVNIFNKPLLKVIEIKTNAENANLIFYNSIGEKIKEENINFDFTIETASLSKGIYLIKITDVNTKEMSTTKVIIN